MRFSKLKLWFLLFGIGFCGILSILLMKISLPESLLGSIPKTISDFELKLLLLINPTILLIILITIGVLLYDKVNLKLPFFERLVGKNTILEKNIFSYGISGGIISAVCAFWVFLIFQNYVPISLLQNEMNPITRFLYGGITEEILVRFGIMTLFVWIFSKIFKSQKNYIFWFGIIISSIIFGILHLPIVIISLNGAITWQLIGYIIFGNAIVGVVFGYLYFKKGLETAMIAHIVTHIVFIIYGIL
ncbi:CPBP family intramembrane metalloprotease [Candidatus Gracilibacteria bacterium]|nr:MAG: CPBP family intramembrane metalloprotease [Candidatus Gracilibacteria bacterium]